MKEVGLLWQCRIFSRYWDELLAECHHSFFFGWNLCNLLLLMNLFMCCINHPKRSSQPVTTQDQQRLQRDTPAHTEFQIPTNKFMRCQLANRDTSRANMLMPTLAHRLAQAVKMRGVHALAHKISRNFTIRDTNQIMEQLNAARATWINIS